MNWSHPQRSILNPSPIILIGGIDSSGGAGIQTDMSVCQTLGCCQRIVLTANTIQGHQFKSDYTSPVFFKEQLESIVMDLLENNAQRIVIKTGMIGNEELLKTLYAFLLEWKEKANIYLICDPVMKSSEGNPLLEEKSLVFFKNKFLKLVDFFMPNVLETEKLLNLKILELTDLINAAKIFVKMGAKNVYMKGGHFFNSEDFIFDFFHSPNTSFFMKSSRINKGEGEFRGTGCALSSAVAVGINLGLNEQDSAVMAKTYLAKIIRKSQKWGENFHLTFDKDFLTDLMPIDFPLIFENIKDAFTHFDFRPLSFIKENERYLYPIVDRANWIERLGPLGIKIIQLRIKDLVGLELENEIIKAVEISKKYGIDLFINDFWELAIKYKAFGVHLGQEDLEKADLLKIIESQLALGLSTHCYYEGSKAKFFNPSYIALGPVYPTILKKMNFTPQGIGSLKVWEKLFDAPLVAIGGINLSNVDNLFSTQVPLISVVSDITLNQNPENQVLNYLNKL